MIITSTISALIVTRYIIKLAAEHASDAIVQYTRLLGEYSLTAQNILNIIIILFFVILSYVRLKKEETV